MHLTLEFGHIASPKPPIASCAELLAAAKRLGVICNLTINGKWRIWAHPDDSLRDVQGRLARAQEENP